MVSRHFARTFFVVKFSSSKFIETRKNEKFGPLCMSSVTLHTFRASKQCCRLHKMLNGVIAGRPIFYCHRKPKWYNLWSFNSWICLAFWFHRKHCGPQTVRSSYDAGILACHLPPSADYTLVNNVKTQVGPSSQMHLSRSACPSTPLLQCTRTRFRGPFVSSFLIWYLVFNYNIIAVFRAL